jgi:hypothetical protein
MKTIVPGIAPTSVRRRRRRRRGIAAFPLRW